MGTCVPTRVLNHAHLANVPITGLDKLLEEELKWLLTVRVSAGSGSGALSLPPSSFTRSLTHSFTYSLPRPPSLAPPLPSPQEDTLASPTHQCPVEGPLLDGYLSLLVELLMFRSTTERYHIGSKPGGDGLIEVSLKPEG